MKESLVFIVIVALIGVVINAAVGQEAFNKISKVVAIAGTIIFIIVLIWAVSKIWGKRWVYQNKIKWLDGN